MSEICQCCGDVGEDRRTLWMACLYEMGELSVPFGRASIHGQYRKFSRMEQHPVWGFNVPVFEEANGEPHNYKFYTLRVCKECRASWMGAIENWFKQGSQQRGPTGTGVYLRKNGATYEAAEQEVAELNKQR
jgi:hypothetical protein